MDSDNLIAGLKPLRDAVARELGTDDADDLVIWEPSQVRTTGTEGVTVTIHRNHHGP